MNPYAIGALVGIAYFFGHPVVTKIKHVFHHKDKAVIVAPAVAGQDVKK